MSNYNFNVTLDGLNNVNANDINTDNIVTDYLTVTKNSSVPLVTPYTSNTNQIASCAFVQDAFINQLLNYVTLDTTQTITALKTFTGQLRFKASTWVSGSDLRILDTTSSQGIQIFNSNDSSNKMIVIIRL